MLTYTQKKAGHLSLEWRNKAGEYAFKVMPGIIQILDRKAYLKGFLHQKLPGKCNIEQLK